MNTVTEVDLQTITCGACGVVFAMPARYVRERKRDHRTWYCPNGHPRAWNGESREEELERQLRSVQAYGTSLRDQLEATERSLRGHKAAKTRLKNRIAAGVCPCCNRSFQNLQRHMAGQHPDFAHEEKS